MTTLQHKFIENIPENIDPGILYVSMEYATAIHKCACGCGNKVVTPFSPGDWQLTYDGKSVSLNPSIDNESFPCKSHYWIKSNNIRWVRDWYEETDQKRSFWQKIKKWL
jgi:hypothetical protein